MLPKFFLPIYLFTTSDPPKYSNSNSPNLCFCLFKGDKNTFLLVENFFWTNENGIFGELEKMEIEDNTILIEISWPLDSQFRHSLKFTCMNGLPKVSTFKTRFEFQLGCILISLVKIIDKLLVVVANSRIVSGQSTQCTVTQN